MGSDLWGAAVRREVLSTSTALDRSPLWIVHGETGDRMAANAICFVSRFFRNRAAPDDEVALFRDLLRIAAGFAHLLRIGGGDDGRWLGSHRMLGRAAS